MIILFEYIDVSLVVYGLLLLFSNTWDGHTTAVSWSADPDMFSSFLYVLSFFQHDRSLGAVTSLIILGSAKRFLFTANLRCFQSANRTIVTEVILICNLTFSIFF